MPRVSTGERGTAHQDLERAVQPAFDVPVFYIRFGIQPVTQSKEDAVSPVQLVTQGHDTVVLLLQRDLCQFGRYDLLR